MERSYAENNLGVLSFDQGRYVEAEASLVRAVAIARQVVAMQPSETSRKFDLGVSMSWLAQTRVRLGQVDSAISQYRQEIALYREIVSHDPRNATAAHKEAMAWHFIANLELKSGRLQNAESDIDVAITKLNELLSLEARNTEWLEARIRAQLMRANILFWKGDHSHGQILIAAARNDLARLQASDPKNTVWSALLPAILDNEQARIALRQRDLVSARNLALAGLAHYSPDDQSLSGERIDAATDALLLAGAAEVALGNGKAARNYWTRALELIDSISNPTPSEMVDRFIALKQLGQDTEAASIARDLDRRGYRHPAYLRFRST